jgi:hypothetical protein
MNNLQINRLPIGAGTVSFTINRKQETYDIQINENTSGYKVIITELTKI